ncbi:MAG TPA: acyltransferase [Bryobacteraceae bacterium]|jgi:peptidoglycan/LPS O-acetylase OafA/YrhL|nr:acyltransferase [Bryobacteraceae bacterium]
MTGRIHSIDSLRAFAMTMVIAQHCGLLPFGWTGVWLFYVISGFVISRNLIAERAMLKVAPLAHYFSFVIRRLFRIVPPYVAYIGMCLIVISLIRLDNQFHEIPYLASFSYNWRMIFSSEPQFVAFGHLWTISVEEQFYVLFPILILLLRRDRAIVGLIAIICAAPVLRNLMSEQMAAHSWDPGRIAFGIYASSFGQFDAFAAGALLAHFEGKIQGNPPIAKWIASVAVLFAIAYFATYVVINIAYGAQGVDVIRNIISGILYGEKREVLAYIVMDLLAVAILAGAIVGWKAFKVIEHPTLVAVGQASYGGYLLHALVLLLLGEAISWVPGQEPILARIVFFVVAWCCTVALARISYSMCERKIIRFGHKVSQRVLLKSNELAVDAPI